MSLKFLIIQICILVVATPSPIAFATELSPDKEGVFRPTPRRGMGFNATQRTQAVLSILPDLKDQPGVGRDKDNKILVEGRVQPYLMLPETLLENLYLMVHQTENMDSVEAIFTDLGKHGFQLQDREILIQRLSEDWQETIAAKKQETPAPWAQSVFEAISPQSQQALAAWLYKELTQFATETWPQNTH